MGVPAEMRKAVPVVVLLCSALLLCVLGDKKDSKEDDGIPKNEVSPLDFLYKPKIGMVYLFNAHPLRARSAQV